MAMKKWEAEHGKGYDVPSVIDHLVSRKVLVDSSWHNDAAPSFMIVDPKREDYGLRIWVDHPLNSMREVRGMSRFMLQDGPFGSEPDYELESDDLEEILIKLFERAGDDRYARTAIRKQGWFVEGEPDETMKEFIQVWTDR